MATVLILDDDEGVGLMLKEVVADQGHQAIRVQKLEDVSPYLRADAVITDLFVGGVYNREAAVDGVGRVRERFGEAPVLILTAHSQAVADADACAPLRVMTKPFEIDTLAAALNELIKSSARS